ncbi:Mu transposase C-terminal domain-containing protein [Methylomagnum sp.]
MPSDPPLLPEPGVATLPEAAWREARRRAEVIVPLAASARLGHAAVDHAATALGLSRRQVYTWVRRYRQGEGLLTDLVPRRSNGGRSQSRLPAATERLITEALEQRYLTRPKPSEAALRREVVRRCRRTGLKPPARNTVRARLDRLDPVRVAGRREGPDAARRLRAVAGATPEVAAPLDLVQMDHTPVDLIVVDAAGREPLGRPYLTLAIDVFSRAILGFLVALEAPSATSVGLCLAHAAADKRPWLEHRGIEAEWPMHGKPRVLSVDNAAEFHGEALRRGCEQHGIELRFRPPGQPQYGGVVERVLGTLMARVHELPGTTFSNPAARGDYAAERDAALTLAELEHWLALAIAVYHGSVHGALGQTPAARWREGLAGGGPPRSVAHPDAFLIDFLPVFRRTLGRGGFVLDHIGYYSDALKPWIARRDRREKFLVRRDPRDLSRIWVLDPDGTAYLELPYRTLARPAITLWEHRQALAAWRARGRDAVDEAALFRMIETQRTLTGSAAQARKQARRDLERRRHLATGAASPAPPAPPEPGEAAPVRPFDEIEEW